MDNSLTLNIQPKTNGRKVVVEMDADRFERLGAALGLFGQEFLESLGQAEREAARGKLVRLRSLKDLR